MAYGSSVLGLPGTLGVIALLRIIWKLAGGGGGGQLACFYVLSNYKAAQDVNKMIIDRDT